MAKFKEQFFLARSLAQAIDGPQGPVDARRNENYRYKLSLPHSAMNATLDQGTQAGDSCQIQIERRSIAICG
jgi:hypothetical protein